MKTKSQERIFTIEISEFKLWFLAQNFGPGWVFGIEDPSKSLKDQEMQTAMTSAQQSLISSEVIKVTDQGDMLVDEFIGGVVFSLIHSEDVIVIKNTKDGSEAFFHFLPQFQVELSKIDNDRGYKISVIKDRSDIQPHIFSNYQIQLNEGHNLDVFSLQAKEFEMALSLFEDGNQKKSKEIMSSILGFPFDELEFVAGYLNPDYHLRINSLYHKLDEKAMASQRYELVGFNGENFWVSYDRLGESDIMMMSFFPLSSDQVEKRFNQFLPQE